MGELARAEEDLSGHEERDEHVDRAMKVLVPAHQVVLVAPVGVAGAVGVVLEDEDLSPDPLLLEAILGSAYQSLEDPLPRLVVGNNRFELIAFWRRKLGMGADIEI